MSSNFNVTPQGQGPIPLLPPGTTTEGMAEATVDKMIAQNPDLASIRDELVSYVTSQFQGIVSQYEQRVLDHMTGSNPVLNFPETAKGADIAQIQRGMDNPWFKANPYATFFSLFLDLSAEMSKIKMNEGMMMAHFTDLVLSMSKDQAEIVKEIHETEAMMHIAAAVANAVGGVACIGGGYMGITRFQTTGMAWTTVGQGIGQLTTAAEKAIDAVFTFHRAELEYMKTINENAMRVLQDRGITAAVDAFKAGDEVISQVLQALNKMIDEAFKAHGFQIH